MNKPKTETNEKSSTLPESDHSNHRRGEQFPDPYDPGSRYWCDYCKRPTYDESSCPHCGRYCST